MADPARMFTAAIEGAKAEGKVGDILDVVSRTVASRRSGPQYTDFETWVNSPAPRLSGQFAATLRLFEDAREEELKHLIVRFWSGDPLGNPVIKRALKELGLAGVYPLARLPKESELALERFLFATKMMIAAGYRGWVLLIDEAELMRYYSARTRARAYAELARWLGSLHDASDGRFPGLGAVVTIINSYDVQQLIGNGDLESLPAKLRFAGRPEDDLLATRAERGMRLIMHEKEPLHGLSKEQVEITLREVRHLYSTAFDWPAPDIPSGWTGLGGQVMRRLVRRWITEWDLRRLFPEIEPQLTVQPLPEPAFRDLPDTDLEPTTDDL
jgi:hypothetical protein